MGTANTETTVTSGGVGVDVVKQESEDNQDLSKFTQAMMLRAPNGQLVEPLTEKTGQALLAQLKTLNANMAKLVTWAGETPEDTDG